MQAQKKKIQGKQKLFWAYTLTHLVSNSDDDGSVISDKHRFNFAIVLALSTSLPDFSHFLLFPLYSFAFIATFPIHQLSIICKYRISVLQVLLVEF